MYFIREKRRGNKGFESLHNEKLYALYSSPNILRVIKSRRMRRGGMCGGEERCIQGFGGET
jgi:hypothetical protein